MASATYSQSILSLSEPAQTLNTLRWYAAHVRANHEKTAAEQLKLRSVECFVPLYESARQWKDRRVKLQLPLFPGYVLVRIELAERVKVLQAPGVARLVSFNGQPAPLSDIEIDLLRTRLRGTVQVEPHPYLQIGQRARVVRGPLEGFEGFFVRQQQKCRIVLSIDAILRSIAVEVDLADVTFLATEARTIPNLAFPLR